MAGIYIHIPFCKQACHYCDFHFSTSLKAKDEMLEALLKEIDLQKNYFNEPSTGLNETVETIYFGGGTPSLLSGEEIKMLLNKIGSLFKVEPGAEITLEANPDDLSKEKITAMRKAGVNRLSIGIQSFDDNELRWMNRVHSAAEAGQSVKDSQEAGFENITIDLIYGTPLLTDEQWKKNLHIVRDLNVSHLSCYALTVEPRTTLAHFIAAKKQPRVDDAKQAAHFEILIDWAEQNRYEQYEISNFARDMKYSIHNSSYWSGAKYLGIGPSAHSFNDVSRQWNIRNNAEYIRSIKESKIPSEIEILTLQNKFNEYVMTSLRTMWGCNLDTMKKKFGEVMAEKFFRSAQEFIRQGLMDQRKQNFVLTRKGKLFADRVAGEMFESPEDSP